MLWSDMVDDEIPQTTTQINTTQNSFYVDDEYIKTFFVNNDIKNFKFYEINENKSYTFKNFKMLFNYLYRYKKNGLKMNDIIIKPISYTLLEITEVINTNLEFFNNFINILTKIYINKFINKNNKFIKTNIFVFIYKLHKLYLNDKKNIINENVISVEFNKLNNDAKIQIIKEIYNF